MQINKNSIKQVLNYNAIAVYFVSFFVGLIIRSTLYHSNVFSKFTVITSAIFIKNNESEVRVVTSTNNIAGKHNKDMDSHRDEVKILTFNAGLLVSSIFGKTLFEPTPYTQERLAGIISQLRHVDADIVALQEVYSNKHKEQIISELSDLYPFSFFYERKKRIDVSLPNGLLMLSKFPVDNTELVLFDSNLLTELIAANKGILIGDFKVGDVTLRIANVHVTAGGFIWHSESDKANETRHRQVSQAILSLKENSTGTLPILLGDFNAGPGVSQVNYDHVIEEGFIDTFILGCHKKNACEQVTWDPGNSLNSNGLFSDSPPQRIDHIFVIDQDSAPFEIGFASVVMDEQNIKAKGQLVSASDHYGVLVNIKIKSSAVVEQAIQEELAPKAAL